MTGRPPEQETKRYVELPSPGPDETRLARRSTPAFALPEPGEMLGRYELRSELGRGGMGVVYEAFDPELKRRIAIKLLRPELSDTELERFVEEAQIAAQLEHPVILPVYDVHRTDEGGIYYTMQLVRGRTLEELIGGPASLAEEQGEPDLWSRFKLLQVFVTVCRAVSFAHGRGVIHRDLKPSNVMIGPFAEVYLMDWGVSKILGSKPRPRRAVPFDAPIEGAQGRHDTRAGTMVGTPAYMAPEQARNEGVGRAADVFCLGGVLYHILTGQPPRAGALDEVVHELSRREAPPPRSPRALNAKVPPELDELCTRALAHDPADRPPSAGALADTVQAYLEGRSLRAANPQDVQFLSTYSALEYRRPSIAVDVVLLDRRSDPPRTRLVQRTEPPFVGAWACPGSFVRLEEDLEASAQRILRDKLAFEGPVALTQLRAYGELRRDPRTRVVSIGYLAVPDDPDDTGDWFTVEEVEGELRLTPEVELAFDHAQIVLDALRT